MRLLWGSGSLLLLIAWVAQDHISSVNATITLALDATQLALASGLLGAASVAGLGFVKGLVKGKALGDSSYGAPDSTYGVPDSSYGIVESSYGAPDSSYGAPEPTYGAPHQTYATPDYTYSSPAPSYTTTPEVSYSQPEKDEYGSPSAPAIVQLIKSEKLEEHPAVEVEHLHENTVAEDKEVAKLEKEVADNLEKLEKLNLLRQKRQRQSTVNKGNVRFQHGRSVSWPQLSLPVLKLGSYRDYVARVRGLRVRGKRETGPDDQKNIKVSRRGETGSDLTSSIDQIFKEIRRLDAVDCGKVYVCEIAATPVRDRSEGEEAVITLLAVAGEREDAAQYRWAATRGEEGREGCRLAFPRCPLAGLSQLVTSYQ